MLSPGEEGSDMENHSSARLIMLGAAAETRGSLAAVIESWRALGLFQRWPIDCVPLRRDGALKDKAELALRAVGRFAAAAWRARRFALHLHTTPDAGFWRDALFMLAALALRRPVILQLHSGGWTRFYEDAGSPARALLRWLFAHAACVVAPSEAQRGWVRGVCREARAVCLPPAITCPAISNYDAVRPRVVVFLGRLDAQKGLYDLLQALASVRPAVPGLRLVCAGEGDRAAVTANAERLGIAEAVKFTGWVGPSGKRALLETAAVLVLPSYAEGMPMSVLEAMAAGVPVVATPVGGVTEVVVDGVSGLLAAPGDTATLARQLRSVLTDPALGARLGAAGRESVRLRFAPERALARLEEIYRDAGLAANGETTTGDSTGVRQAA
jgi:glycosyltransferase involved in cell wall biosynthesis